MTNAGDAAEEIVKISLEGTEMALRLTGAAAKNIAVALYAIANDQTKRSTRGKHWLKSELKSGTDMSVLMLRQDDMKTFVSAAKQYGLSYCVVRDEKSRDDGQVAVFVRSADASRASHIVERFGLAQVTPATTIESEEPEKDAFIDALGLTDEVKIGADEQEIGEVPVSEQEAESAPVYENPPEARTERSPSGPSSETGISGDVMGDVVSDPVIKDGMRRESVRKKLSDIKVRMATDKATEVAKHIPTPPVPNASKNAITK